MIAFSSSAAQQLLLFGGDGADLQPSAGKKKTHARRPRAVSHDVQFSLFDKHSVTLAESSPEYDPDDAIRSRRICELMELPVAYLTEAEQAELDAIVAARREKVRSRWTAKVEAKRRAQNGLPPYCSPADIFVDADGSIQWRVDAAPVSIYVEDDFKEEY